MYIYVIYSVAPPTHTYVMSYNALQKKVKNDQADTVKDVKMISKANKGVE